MLKRNDSKFYNGYYSEMRHRQLRKWMMNVKLSDTAITLISVAKKLKVAWVQKKNRIEFNWIKHEIRSRKTEIVFYCKHTPKSLFTTFFTVYFSSQFFSHVSVVWLSSEQAMFNAWINYSSASFCVK